ncbi:hypothetical protein AHMF7605_00600 [Adhaeribacter arboris]|uniref:Outer membrane protein beta-barrel domain-containing protein n=1 Tax=Adhaeribacter arboris TaxID=2072846 RepID=A0A2T2Y9D4_9BACT|nr:hypothetical protein [Adhaeribacter arboris]PSR52125.1 hypothetical protein AHMF7605_00600 [Adhaeribacter arboris]
MRQISFTFFLFCLLFVFTNTFFAQKGGSIYKTGIGLRGGYYATGLSIKQVIKNEVAVESILGAGSRRCGVMLPLIYEKHDSAFQARGLKWFYGLGGHVDSYQSDCYYRRKRYVVFDRVNVAAIGVDGVLDLEYAFPEIPFTLTLDYKPFAETLPGELMATAMPV